MAQLQQTQANIEAHALAKHVRMSPQKARLVMDLIRGQKAQDALQTLRFTQKRSAKHIEKVLRSAIANAERKAEDAGAPLDVDELYVNNCYVNEGTRWKRLRPAPMGRAFRYQKRTAHLWVGVAEHHVAAAERVAAIEAETEAQKGVRGTARRVRKALTGKQGPHPKKGKKYDDHIGKRTGFWAKRISMGQKTHPYGFRLGYNKPWKSRWYADRDYAELLHEDVKLRTELKEKLKSAGISSIDIERAANKLVVRIYTARPGIIIGRKGAEIDKLKQDVQKRTKREVHIDIQEVHRPELDAQLVAESIALQLEKRVAFRRAMRKAVDSALRFGCKGIKVRVAGRLNGAEIARKEWYLQGRLPLQTLRADIDFGMARANTTYGVIGVKCWVYQGENVPKRASKVQKERETIAAA
jgi:small subunit ribosomal protein S3